MIWNILHFFNIHKWGRWDKPIRVGNGTIELHLQKRVCEICHLEDVRVY